MTSKLGRSATFYTLSEAGALCGAGASVIRRWLEETGIPLHRRTEGPAVHWKDLRRCLAARNLPIPSVLEGGPRLLLVEDDQDQLMILLEALSTLWGRTSVATASDGLAAMSIIERFHPDLLVTDLGLPDLDGLALCRRVRSNPELAHTKILALTGMAGPDPRGQAVAAGADDFLFKPVSPLDLQACALRLLGEKVPPG